MAYSAELSRVNPSMFLFLIDQSGSMADSFGGGEQAQRKADGVATAINRLLQSLVIKCAKSEGVRDYYHVGVIGYGAQIGHAFTGPLAGRELVPISEIANMPARIEERIKKLDDGAGGLVEQAVKFPVWFDPIANGGTPMCEAFKRAENTLNGWLSQHPSCFPPILINISDGEPTDGDPSQLASSIQALFSSDGNVLLFNLHLSSQRGPQVVFPDNDGSLPDDHARLLFNMSSFLPQYLRDAALQEGMPVSESSRGFVFNADMVSVIQFLDIGTRPSNLR